MRVRTFAPLRPTPESVARIASLPYDVVDTEEARNLAEGNPLSLFHVIRAEIDFPPETDPYAEGVYARAKENLERLRMEGHLIREAAPTLYLYRQQMGSHIQQGIVGLCHVDDYDADRIKKHEKTRPDKEDDRTRLTDTLGANPEPVFLTYRDDPELSRRQAEAAETAPLYDFTAEDGIRHVLWKLPGAEAAEAAFARVACAYVADGHHRSASAARVARLRREADPAAGPDADHNWFLCVLFPASELQILPYNRWVHDLRGETPERFLEAVAEVATVSPADEPTPPQPGSVRMYLDGRWYDLAFREGAGADDPVGRLDVSRLQDGILGPLLGIDNPRTSKRIDFVGGIRGTAALERRVDRAGGVAFSLYPVTVEQLMAIADAGLLMPPKSTWFEPKLRSGLLIHTF
ncbi:MAG: DUF1015 domain-containing protein [Puniceicoccaceae bacterium]|nr:MAG: DUF1015 domain-containing protein [Puniceicoccaceae bacterium]